MKPIMTIGFLLLIFLSSINSKNVIIVGAGIAGLSAADYLKKNGHTVKILEARNRIGGRISTDSSMGFIVDMGAGWIHGIENNPINNLATSSNQKTYVFDYNSIKYYSNSNLNLSSGQIMTDLPLTSNNFMKYLENVRSNQTTDTPLRQTINNYISSQGNDGKVNLLLNNWAYVEVEVNYANSLNNLSTMNFDNVKRFQGEDALLPDGYIKLLEPLANGQDIVFNFEVSNIDQTSDSIKVASTSGQTHSADAVILTVPLGYLKKNRISFNPPLSDAKKRSIEKLGFGVLNKVVVEFFENFWDDVNVINLISNPVNPFSFIINYFKVSGKNVLIFLISGTAFPIETSDDTAIRNQITSALRAIYPNRNTTIKNLIYTKWGSDPYTYGSYTSFNVDSSPSDIQQLILPEGKLYLAGEHCNADYLQTVQGAHLSGLEAARKIHTSSNFIQISLFTLVLLYLILL